MSISLVQDALELLDANTCMVHPSEMDAAHSQKSKKSPKNSTTNSIFKGKKVTCVLDEIKKKTEKKDNTKKALKFLKRVDKICSSTYMKEVKKMHTKALEEKYKRRDPDEAEESSGSVFTEADFNRLKSHHFKTPRHGAFNRKLRK
ncbi:Active regulator of SIRT1 [Trinorchestia longiramus]|nr:Active regulator of SIRT1 [Trinorchestia longiramus]